MKLASGLWIAAIDGARGLVLINTGTAAAPSLTVHRRYAQENPPTREQGDDKPGRAYASTGDRRSSVEAPDLHRRAEDDFVHGIVRDLEADARSGAFAAIVIAAPPAALGEFRKAAGPELHKRVVAEIDADLVKLPVAEIAASIARTLEA